ncbi:MAG: DUF2924 domain-containing protein [Agarilytica sp.]
MQYDVIAHVASLEDLPSQDLKSKWTQLYGAPPTTNRRAYLITRIAYRIQELAYGGLTEGAKQGLDKLIDGEIKIDRKSKRLCMPPVGTKIIREYNETEHQVMVTRSGFEYQGRTFKSLSEIARLITGTRWSGPVFFGLKTKSTKKII